jgi:hypothetical protein
MIGAMARLFESFEFLNRGWDVRMLEGISLRKLFLLTIASVFLLGMEVAIVM